MLSLFRNNQFTTAILLAFYVVLTHLSALLGYVQPPGEGMEGGVLYQAWLDWIEAQPFWSAVGAVALVFVQALAVNILADEFRLMDDRNWLPGVFYALIAAGLPDFLFMSAPLVAVTFVPMVLRRIFKAYKQPKATALVFDAAFWAVVASLFYPPVFFLLLAVYAGINVMRSFNFREQMVLLTGVLTATFLAWCWYFWTDRGLDYWAVQFGGLIDPYRFDLVFDSKTVLQTVLLGVLFFTVLLSYGAYLFRKLIQTQKCVSVLYWFLFVGGWTILLQRNPSPTHFLLAMPSIGIFLAMSFSALRSRLIAELFHLALLGFILFIQFNEWVDKGL